MPWYVAVLLLMIDQVLLEMKANIYTILKQEGFRAITEARNLWHKVDHEIRVVILII
jgi:hypothetical protein